jgi:ATP-binding cassette subfamily F protein 3
VEKSKETTIGYLHQDLLSFDTNENIRKWPSALLKECVNWKKKLKDWEMN